MPTLDFFSLLCPCLLKRKSTRLPGISCHLHEPFGYALNAACQEERVEQEISGSNPYSILTQDSASLQAGDDEEALTGQEQELRYFMVERLTLYSSLMNQPMLPHASGEEYKELLDREARRLAECTTHDLAQLLTHLYVQFQEVIHNFLVAPDAHCLVLQQPFWVK